MKCHLISGYSAFDNFARAAVQVKTVLAMIFLLPPSQTSDTKRVPSTLRLNSRSIKPAVALANFTPRVLPRVDGIIGCRRSDRLRFDVWLANVFHFESWNMASSSTRRQIDLIVSYTLSGASFWTSPSEDVQPQEDHHRQVLSPSGHDPRIIM